MFLTIFCFLVGFVHGWFENCNLKVNVSTSTTYITSPGYPDYYNPGSSCKYYLEAPTGYIIDLKCSFDLLEVGYDCSSQRLYVSRDGDKELNYAEFFCGYSSFTKVSVGNEISFGYTSNNDGDGWSKSVIYFQITQNLWVKFHLIGSNSWRFDCTAQRICFNGSFTRYH
jgi:hypothetical protein